MDSDKIQQYVLLAKGARGRAVVELIVKATSDPGVFGFGELLACQSVIDLRGTEFASSYELLQLFAYGTWPEYKRNSSNLPPLNDAQQLKLKQLTVVSIALVEKVVAYDKLMQSLEIGSMRELEDFIITHCFYASIIQARLDQQKRCLMVRRAIGRDVRPEEMGQVADKLSTWIGTCEDLLRSIEERVAKSAEASTAAAERRKALDTRVEEVKRNVTAERRMDAQIADDAVEFMDEDSNDARGMFSGLMRGAADMLGMRGERGEREPGPRGERGGERGVGSRAKSRRR